nr:MAG TPA: hypothetical protein [Caudoviricetes sp.]
MHICCNRQYFTIFLLHCQGRISCKRGSRKSTIKFYKNSERFLFILKQYK